PRVLMLDEPTLGLPPVLVSKIFETVRAINGDGVTVLMVEQNVRQALTLAHRASGGLRLALRACRLASDGGAPAPRNPEGACESTGSDSSSSSTSWARSARRHGAASPASP